MKKIPFIAVWFVLIGCFFALNLNNRAGFEELTGREAKDGQEKLIGKYEARTAVNLDKELDKKDLSRVLELNNYVNDTADADFVAQFIVDKLAHDTIPEALFDFKKRMW